MMDIEPERAAAKLKTTGPMTLEEFMADLEKPLPWWERAWYGARRFIVDLPWWFRWRFQRKHQYHLVRLGLRPGYYDPCIRLLHAILEETSRFVAHEDGPRGIVNWDSEPNHQAAIRAYRDAAAWWAANSGRLDACVNMAEEAQFWGAGVEHMVAVLRHLPLMWYA